MVNVNITIHRVDPLLLLRGGHSASEYRCFIHPDIFLVVFVLVHCFIASNNFIH